jgi:hypothetical protein
MYYTVFKSDLPDVFCRKIRKISIDKFRNPPFRERFHDGGAAAQGEGRRMIALPHTANPSSRAFGAGRRSCFDPRTLREGLRRLCPKIAKIYFSLYSKAIMR